MGKMKNKGVVVTVGTFDGVHSGHREVLNELLAQARNRDLHPMVITFDRHPLEVVAPQRAPKLIQSREERNEMLQNAGVEVEELRFTPEFASLTAGEWMEELRKKYNAEVLISGYDNKFGSDGNKFSPADYVALGREKGIEVIVAKELPGVCSSLIRKALEIGDVVDAARMLGRTYKVSGEVVKGRQLGRTLGFPTANVEIPEQMQLPGIGVYAGSVDGEPAVVNIGNNPTVDEGNPITVEAHLIDFTGDLYGKRVEVEFHERLRGEEKFDSLEELKKQIAEDINLARKL